MIIKDREDTNELKNITILIPCYNEDLGLKIFYDTMIQVIESAHLREKYDFAFLFVNDGSVDKTLNIMQQLHEMDSHVSYLSLSRNFGKEIAMLAGMDYVDADAVIIMDADLQDPPSLIPEMICKWEDGYADVYGKRRSREGETWFKKFSSHAYYQIFSKLTNTPGAIDVGDFRLLDRQCIEALRSMRECQRYTKGLFNWIGYKKIGIEYDRQPRAKGTTKWNYWKLFHLAMEGITSFSTVPLHISSWLGMVVSLCSFIYMLFIVIRTLLYGDDVPGYPSLVAIILFISGVQLIVLGIIGEYLGRVFNESKRRPVYLAEEFNGEKIYREKG